MILAGQMVNRGGHQQSFEGTGFESGRHERNRMRSGQNSSLVSELHLINLANKFQPMAGLGRWQP